MGAVAKATARPKYVICNADESEPGTFKDRVLLEEDPFAIIEAMTIAGFACGCEKGFVYLRGEYPLAEERLSGAIAQARAARLLGENVIGAGFGTGLKWEACRNAPGTGENAAHYVVCNADEGEPGTFKDRVLLTSYADLVFEGMTIAGLAVGAKLGLLYLRGEYRKTILFTMLFLPLSRFLQFG